MYVHLNFKDDEDKLTTYHKYKKTHKIYTYIPIASFGKYAL